MSTTTYYEITGSARPAGQNVLHTVRVNGNPIGTRRSAHCYNYAFVRRVGPGEYVVTRYSRSGTERGGEKAIFLVSEFV